MADAVVGRGTVTVVREDGPTHGAAARTADWTPTDWTDTDWVDTAVDRQLDRLWPPGPDAASLRRALAGAGAGGKRFRPRLVAAVHDLLGGEERAALQPVAAAVELLHTAFVVHDDVIDGDDRRRGRDSVPGTFLAAGRAAGAGPRAARSYAIAGAVLTGDLALSAAVRAVATAPLPAPQVGRLLDLVDRALTTSASGELADVRFSLGVEEVSLEDVLTMAEHKTAAYSFQLPMQLGAVLAGAPAALVDGVGEVGRLLGIAFQLRDDLLGVFGDPARTGKSNVADLREGKVTPLVVHARTTPGWAAVEGWWGDPEITDSGAEAVRAALEDGGSRSFVERLATHHEDAADLRAVALGFPPGFVARLLALGGRTVAGVA